MRIYRKHRIRNEKNAHEGANSLAGLIGNYSQLALFLLAVFGYFYTVQQIYQNQKLSEENSKLLNENEKLQSNSEKLKANFEKDLQEYKIQIATLADKYEQKELEYKEKEGSLVNKEDVYSQLFEFHQEVRNSLLAIPDRITDTVLALYEDRNKVHQLIYESIHGELIKLKRFVGKL